MQIKTKIKSCVICGFNENSNGFLGLDILCKCIKCGMVYTNIDWKEEIIRTDKDSWWQEFYHFSVERSKESLEQLCIIKKYKTEGDLLDYGCGGGNFLALAKKEGFAVTGIEIDENVANIVRNDLQINVKVSTIYQISFPEKKFDIVTLWNVLEHCPKPNLVISELKKILKKDGYLFIEVPNDSSVNRLFAIWLNKIGIRNFLNQIYVKTAHIAGHVNHFNIKTLSKIIENNDMRVVKIIQRDSPIGLISETFNKDQKIPLWLMRLLMLMVNLIGKMARRKSRIVIICQNNF
ncbi:MAG: methyltransferase type 11 [uncultured bacterium]|nr:MAG: methyltransferase type 11 [uncultured bacterium]